MAIIEGSTLTAKVAPTLISAVMKPLAEKVASQVRNFTSDKWEQYKTSLVSYLEATQERHKYFNSEVFSNEGKLLEAYYLPLTLVKEDSRGHNTKVQIDGFPADLFSAYKDILVVDTAGMGKSTLLKYIFLKQIEAGGSIPVFVELRRISATKPLVQFILEEVSNGADPITENFLQYCLRSGVFTFFLDGFDEVADDDKKFVASEIVKLKASANKNKFILSSRRERSLASLAEFHKFRIQPLSKEEAFRLIRILSPIEERAESLIAKLKEISQANLHEFLKNPLLVSLLVKSYLHSPILPVRLSEFYRQVFDALYQNHDAQKELWGFTRKKSSGLDLDRFHKALRALGYLTYRESKLEFSTDELHAQIERAKTLTADTNYAAADLCDDLLRAVPLFFPEGTKIRWAHRSLQEYFAAAYICVDAKGNQEKILNSIYEKSILRHANLLRLCADIDEKTFKQSVVKRFLYEKLELIRSRFPTRDFPDIDPHLLATRRLFTSKIFTTLFVFERSMVDHDAAFEILISHPEVGEFFEAADNSFLLNEDFLPIPDEDEIAHYAYMSCETDDSVILSIIEDYLGWTVSETDPKICVAPSYKDLVPGYLYKLDDNPHNVLNSPENFESTTQLLDLLDSRLYITEKMAELLEEILKSEREAAELDIDF